MHHGQSRGENTRKVCKKLLNFWKTEGILKSRREIINFRESGGICTKTWKIGGNAKFVVDD